MGLFSKKTLVTPTAPAAQSHITDIRVLGAGCKSCHAQYEYVRQAVSGLGITVEVEYVTDPAQFAKYGVMRMPAIAVNEKVISSGTVLKPAAVEKLLKTLL